MFGVLGPLEVRVDDRLATLGGPKQRAVLALLLVESGRVVSIDRFIDSIWGDDASDGAQATLQVYISNLRKTLEPAAAQLGIDRLIATQRPGYTLSLAADALDLLAFRNDAENARRLRDSGELLRASLRFKDAEARWRGPALADLADEPFARALCIRLEAERHQVRLERLDCDLGLGRHLELLGDLHALVEANPLDEQVRGMLMLALYRCGRQAEALGAYQDARRVLVDELGIDPGPALANLEHAILAHDPSLDVAKPQRRYLIESTTTIARSMLAPDVVLVLEGRQIPISRAVTTIGRREDRDVVLEGNSVSRSHAELRRSADGYRIVDVGSTNGTRVNDAIVSDRVLQPGDEIEIGGHRLRFERAQ